MAVAFSNAVLGALITGRAEAFDRFELDQFLQHGTDRVAAVYGPTKLKPPNVRQRE